MSGFALLEAEAIARTDLSGNTIAGTNVSERLISGVMPAAAFGGRPSLYNSDAGLFLSHSESIPTTGTASFEEISDNNFNDQPPVLFLKTDAGDAFSPTATNELPTPSG